MSTINMTPLGLATAIREALPLSNERLSIEDRLFWVEVGNHLGEPELTNLRRVVAFMSKVGSF